MKPMLFTPLDLRLLPLIDWLLWLGVLGALTIITMIPILIGYGIKHYVRPVAGCCSTCYGRGTYPDPQTDGKCWDCRGTGHCHELTQRCKGR